LQGQENHAPEHPFREAAAQHEGDSAAFLPQANPRKHQANYRRRWREHEEYIDDVVQELWRCHGFLEFAAVFRQAAGALLRGAPTACWVSRTRLAVLLGNTSCSVADPKFDQTGHSGDGQQRACGQQPSSKAPAREPGYDGSHHSATCPYRRDDVSHPVDEV
jgi:hypothetical protein